MKLAARLAEMTMNRNTRSPLYELRLSATGAIDSQAIDDWVGIWAPIATCVAGLTASIAWPGKTPARRHSVARIAIVASAKRSASRARSAASVRGRPRKVMPNALQKQAAASAADSASTAPTAGANIFSTQDGNSGLNNMA